MTHTAAIEQLFKAHYASLHRLAVALVHDEDLARDLVQDAFLPLLDMPEGSLPAPGYLYKAVRNRCLNHIRDCGIHRRVADRLFIENDEYDAEQWPDEETIERIYNIIGTDISQQARRVLDLRFGKGMSFARIAMEMGISESAIYRHLSHALVIIRQKLNENG